MENAVFAEMARGDALKMLNLMNPAMEFKCNMKGEGIHGGESIIYDEKSIAKCPSGTSLEIQNEDGSWSACKDLKFKLNQARCVPIGREFR